MNRLNLPPAEWQDPTGVVEAWVRAIVESRDRQIAKALREYATEKREQWAAVGHAMLPGTCARVGFAEDLADEIDPDTKGTG